MVLGRADVTPWKAHESITVLVVVLWCTMNKGLVRHHTHGSDREVREGCKSGAKCDCAEESFAEASRSRGGICARGCRVRFMFCRYRNACRNVVEPLDCLAEAAGLAGADFAVGTADRAKLDEDGVKAARVRTSSLGWRATSALRRRSASTSPRICSVRPRHTAVRSRNALVEGEPPGAGQRPGASDAWLLRSARRANELAGRTTVP